MEPLLYEEVELGKEYYVDSIHKCIKFEVFPYNKDKEIPKSDYTKWFDYDRIDSTIVLRTRKVGDVIKTKEVGGTKKLKDLMIDMKIYRGMRDGVPVVAVGSQVLWLVGYRSSEGYKVTDATQNILQVKVY
jgi:tRNA(Ile)-lysidine synthase